MKKAFRHIFVIATALLALTSCEKLTIPVITEASVTETEPAVIEAKAVMTSKQIDECGLIYSSKSSQPSFDSYENIIYGELESDGTFSTTVTLQTDKKYWFVFFATNELGTTTSETFKVHTSLYKPGANDNPLPNP